MADACLEFGIAYIDIGIMKDRSGLILPVSAVHIMLITVPSESGIGARSRRYRDDDV
jgi:hypothetical protein